MNRIGWRLALFVVSVAALATTGWSLYAVARHYGAPQGIAGAAVAVFDGIAYACLHLASEASASGRSAFGPRITALGMASVSAYLNITHAQMIHGGRPAAVFFAVPTLGLLAVSEMSWAGPRAARRAENGERPYRPPVFGGIAWTLAPFLAGKTVKARAVEFIEHAGTSVAQTATQPVRHSASEVLRARFAEMDPADAIRIAHDAQPGLPPAELASLLITYGVVVDVVQVALVLSDHGSHITVERGDAPQPETVTAVTGTVTAPVTAPVTQVSPDAITAPEVPATPAVTDTVTAVTLADLATVAGVTVPAPGETLSPGQLLVVLRWLRYQDDPPLSYRQAVVMFRLGGFVGSEERVRRAWAELMTSEEEDGTAAPVR